MSCNNRHEIVWCANAKVGAPWACGQPRHHQGNPYRENFKSNPHAGNKVKSHLKRNMKQLRSNKIAQKISVFDADAAQPLGNNIKWQWTGGGYPGDLATQKYLYWYTVKDNTTGGTFYNPTTSPGSNMDAVITDKTSTNGGHQINVFGANQSQNTGTTVRRARCELSIPAAELGTLNSNVWSETFKTEIEDNLNLFYIAKGKES